MPDCPRGGWLGIDAEHTTTSRGGEDPSSSAERAASTNTSTGTGSARRLISPPTAPADGGVDAGPAGGEITASTRSVSLDETRARDRWRKLRVHALRVGRRRVLRTLRRSAAKMFGVTVVMMVASAAALKRAEGEPLCEQGRDLFFFFDDPWNCWIASIYVIGLVSYRVGYGDVLIVTTPGRMACMVACSLLIPCQTVFTIRLVELWNYTTRPFVRRILKATHPKWEDHVYFLLDFTAICFVGIVNCLSLALRPGFDGEYISLTDVFWYSFASVSSVGYGDIAITSLPLFSWSMFFSQYVALLFGVTCFESLLLRGFCIANRRFRRSV